MPIYEYTCPACNEVFSELQKLNADPKDTLCPKCGSNDVKRNLSAIAKPADGRKSSGSCQSCPSAGGCPGSQH